MMSSSTEVVLSLGYDVGIANDLHAYLTQPNAILDGQHLDQVAGKAIHPDGHPGSGQAGSVRVYLGLIRRCGAGAVVEFLEAAPWGRGKRGEVWLYDEWEAEPQSLRFPAKRVTK